MSQFPLDHVSEGPGASAPDPAPAAIVLHGRGADETDLLRPAAELPDDLHVVSLRAPTPLGPGYTWYELDLSAGGLEKSQPDPEDFAESRRLIDESVDAAVERYDLDPARLGIFGFSQGGIVGMASVLERPERYRWVAALHSYLPESHHDVSEFAASGRAAFVGAGEADEVIPASRSRLAAETLESAGLDVTFRTYPTGHGIGRDELADVVEWVEGRY
ncbi:MAG: alpha/beta hydrolase [Halobacteriaceae archaeon]